MENKSVNKDSNDNSSRKIEGFEDFNIYKQARILTKYIYEITRKGEFSRDFGLVTQIRRAAVSIMSNISEGFERGTNKEFIQFLYYSKGSCGEVRTQLTVALDQKYIDRQIHDELNTQCRRISGMISNLISYLHKSHFHGSKFKKQQCKNVVEVPNEVIEKIKKDWTKK